MTVLEAISVTSDVITPLVWTPLSVSMCT